MEMLWAAAEEEEVTGVDADDGDDWIDHDAEPTVAGCVFVFPEYFQTIPCTRVWNCPRRRALRRCCRGPANARFPAFRNVTQR